MGRGEPPPCMFDREGNEGLSYLRLEISYGKKQSAALLWSKRSLQFLNGPRNPPGQATALTAAGFSVFMDEQLIRRAEKK